MGVGGDGTWRKNAARVHHLSYWRAGEYTPTPAEQAELAGDTPEAKEARKFADWDYAFGNKSPLDKESKRLVWGAGNKYLADKYGALVDLYPSKQAVAKQLAPPTTHAVLRHRMQDKGFPRVTHLVQRWRKPCSNCEFKEVLEKPSTECAAPDCQENAPEEPAPKVQHVRVCNPGSGCHVVDIPVHSRDALKDQILKGQAQGIADPFGVVSEFEDEREPASAVLGARHEDNNYGHKTGEPLSDLLTGSWDGQNGVAGPEGPRVDAEKDEPVAFHHYGPHTKGTWSGAEGEEEEEEGGEGSGEEGSGEEEEGGGAEGSGDEGGSGEEESGEEGSGEEG